MSLVGVLFANDHAHDHGSESTSVPGGLIPPNEEHIPLLIDKFLQNVHTKNPVLDVEQLVKHARNIASQGLGWDAWSCLVLLASALGTIAKSFGATTIFPSSPSVGRATTQTTSAPDGTASQRELQQAESYFVLACRRLGSLQYSILGSQCYFFAGGKLCEPLEARTFFDSLIRLGSLPHVHNAAIAELAVLCTIIPALSATYEVDSWYCRRYPQAWRTADSSRSYSRHQTSTSGGEHVLVVFQERMRISSRVTAAAVRNRKLCSSSDVSVSTLASRP